MKVDTCVAFASKTLDSPKSAICITGEATQRGCAMVFICFQATEELQEMSGRDLAALALHTKPRLSYDVGAVVFNRTLAPFTSPAWHA